MFYRHCLVSLLSHVYFILSSFWNHLSRRLIDQIFTNTIPCLIPSHYFLIIHKLRYEKVNRCNFYKYFDKFFTNTIQFLIVFHHVTFTLYHSSRTSLKEKKIARWNSPKPKFSFFSTTPCMFIDSNECILQIQHQSKKYHTNWQTTRNKSTDYQTLRNTNLHNITHSFPLEGSRLNKWFSFVSFQSLLSVTTAR